MTLLWKVIELDGVPLKKPMQVVEVVEIDHIKNITAQQRVVVYLLGSS